MSLYIEVYGDVCDLLCLISLLLLQRHSNYGRYGINPRRNRACDL
jgi:hypothetical protein